MCRLEQQILRLLPSWTLTPIVKAFQAMRGISEIGAVILVAEIGDFNRFVHPRQLVSYLGLSPSEHSSGKSIIRGPITKAGSTRGRRVLIEGAWAYRMPARVGTKIASRQDGLAKDVLDIAWKAQIRLCQRFRAMYARGKNKNVTITAVAREMACFLWAIARSITLPNQVALAS
jgi:transposase